jgi:hypothetical protein
MITLKDFVVAGFLGLGKSEREMIGIIRSVGHHCAAACITSVYVDVADRNPAHAEDHDAARARIT